uniref:DNA replication ATP-dependent helicase/nuclease DNA2-like n=1 Tax=Nicotiana sylvestris TaxID=4096 RepID=A0A1U7X2A1_NICSY|nr:PREDICTED: DNA replication ATP-dependent helicase/nuclease DNA2-like [Nicotiana sylvestris]
MLHLHITEYHLFFLVLSFSGMLLLIGTANHKTQGIDFIRIGRYEVVHEEVRENCLSMMDTHGLEEIKQRIEQSKVVAVTCLGITSPLLSNKRFDVYIMDEAGQTTLPGKFL